MYIKFFKFIRSFIFVFLMLLIFFVPAYFIYYNLESFIIYKAANQQSELMALNDELSLKNLLPARLWSIKDLEIDAESAISVKIDSSKNEKILFSKNEAKKMPIASLTKLMTAIVVLENIDSGDLIEISKKSISGELGSNLVENSIFLAEDLLKDMIIESNNVAARAFAESMPKDEFVLLMNKKAKEIELSDTFFAEPTGVADLNYSTTKDIVKLINYIKENKKVILDITKIKEFDLYSYNGAFSHKAENTNKLLADPKFSTKIIGGKTGFNLSAGECLALIIEGPNKEGYIINVILNSKDRFSDMEKLINWINLAYIW